MELLVCVVNREEHLDRVLSGLVELGITGATVLNSQGMAQRVARQLPVLAGLQSVREGMRPHNATVFSVVRDHDKVEAAVRMISETCGDLVQPGTGVVFTIPVTLAKGLAEETTAES
jgi:nitrogen regulatory protein PII